MENNKTIAVRTHLGWNLSSFSCVATIAQWLSLLPDDGIIRRRHLMWLHRGWCSSPANAVLRFLWRESIKVSLLGLALNGTNVARKVLSISWVNRNVKNDIRKSRIGDVITTDPLRILNEQKRFYRSTGRKLNNANSISSFLNLNMP